MASHEHQHHSIWTPELVEISMPLAGIARRCLAMLIDQTILMGINLTLWILAIFSMIYIGAQLNSTTAMAIVFVSVSAFTVCLYIVYFWSMHTFNNGRTLGKQFLNIRLVNDRGGRVSGWTCFVRALFDVLDFALFFYGISAFMIIATEKEKRIADFASGTLVTLDQ